MIDIWGTHYWFWDIINRETRFLIESHLSKTRTEEDARKLFLMEKLRSQSRPKVIIREYASSIGLKSVAKVSINDTCAALRLRLVG